MPQATHYRLSGNVKDKRIPGPDGIQAPRYATARQALLRKDLKTAPSIVS